MKSLMAILSIPVLLFVCGVAPQASATLKGEYFGQPKPGPKAEPLTVTVLASRPDHYIRAVTFSPDGNEAYWPVIDIQDDFRRWIVGAKMENGVWTQPRIAPFSDKKYYDDVPCLAPNGHELFFLSGRPREEGGEITRERIWRMTREGNSWSEPVPLPAEVNDGYKIHQQISLDREGNLYFGGEGDEGFGSLDIYCSHRIDGEYQTPVNLGPKINGQEGDYAPTVSPDGSYLVFTRNVGEGWTLFISFKTPDGDWTSPIDLRGHLPGIEGRNLGNSHVIADGKCLVFFGEKGETCIPYWIDTSFVEALREAALGDSNPQ
jgi:hypothetical protein